MAWPTRQTALLVVVLIAAAQAQQKPATAPTNRLDADRLKQDRLYNADLSRKRQVALTEAVERLVADSARTQKFKLDDPLPPVARPHPSLSRFKADMVGDVLARMVRPFTGGLYRDSYIRFHLLWVVKSHASPAQLREHAGRLVQLVDGMPQEISGKYRDVKERITFKPPGEGEKRYRRHRELIYAGDMTVGVPPFERKIHAPESFEYMSSNRIAEVKAKLAEAKRLEGTFERIVTSDLKARAYNNRVWRIDNAIRSYRGELLYLIMWTGDPKMADRIMKAIDRHARKRSIIALDLIKYFYQAAFDGALQEYDADVRFRMSKQLKATARAVEGWREYADIHRNLADYAFHLIYMIRDDTLYHGEGGIKRD